MKRIDFGWVAMGLLVCCFGTLSAQENWPRFHGANGSGIASDTHLPTDWTDKDYAWQIELPGVGSSSPVIWGNRLFITSFDAKSGNLTLQCLNADTGAENWHKHFQAATYPIHQRNSFASATPAVDVKHVYVSFADPQHTMLVALTHDGQPVWERDFGTWVSDHGFGVSPQVVGDKVVFFNSQSAEQLPPNVQPGRSVMLAVNCETGADVWQSPLIATRTCYAMPSVMTGENGHQQLIGCNTGNGFFSLDPETGKMNWELPAFAQRTVASVLIADGMAIGSCGSGGGGNVLVAIRPDQKRSGQAPQPVYTLQRSNYVPSPVAINGLLFLFTDKGIGTCVDLQTGKQHWQQRISSGFSGSPVATMDAIYVMDEEGVVYVVNAAIEFKLLSKHALGQSTRATPAIGNGKIYFRTDSKLFCLP